INIGHGGKITITGGTITAQGGGGPVAGGNTSGGGAGIGGGAYGNGGEIVIAGGNITATGGTGTNGNGSGYGYGGGAGVGGGAGNTATGGEIYIVDGVLTAQGGHGAAGIGGGGGSGGGSYGSYNTQYIGADGGEIYIYGGKVNATGGISGAGIGGGTFGYSGKIRVQSGLYGDTVIATRGGFDSNSDPDPMRNHKDIGHGDHILDTEDRAQGGSADTDADIDAPGLSFVDSTWSNSEAAEKIAEPGTALSQLRQLFDETGKSLLSSPQTITIARGDGTQSRVTLYADDDLNNVVRKIVTALNGGNANATSAVNTPAVTGSSGASGVSGSSSSGSGSSSGTNAVNTNALNAASTISNAGSLLNSGASPASLAPSTLSLSSASAAVAALTATPTLTSSGSSGGSGSSGSSSSGGTSGASGSSKKDTGPIENYYTTYVAPGTATPYTSESVEGTMLFRSLPCGVDGALAFEGSREMLEAMALNKIQEARENEFIVNITDAHTGKSIVSNVRVTGNRLNGVLHKNVDIEWDDMAGVEVKWDDDNKKFVYSAKEYTTYLHLAGNETVLQVGANEGDELDISIGDMSAHALGVDRVNVTSREAAGRAITLIDSASDKVSTQRAKFGAYQNRLERNIGNLTMANVNLTRADSRILDTDMAKEAMNYAKLQILAQSGSSMLTQANQLPQNVMSLMR
ncbi:MAG: hypothetical protein IJU98_02605, partial [Synergistaceae bacterium]|nr:hypothetical protein [Synergistaceae bacterium]